ncbi:MAG: plasmid stabilization protein [Burkholderiales bacterium]|nr:plasmid stabilization protein [Burkholderiales bacterium]
MAHLTIRDLPDKTEELLRIRAEHVGISLEAYICHILQKASLTPEDEMVDIALIAEKYFGARHGIELALPERKTRRSSIDFIE